MPAFLNNRRYKSVLEDGRIVAGEERSREQLGDVRGDKVDDILED
jgi:hypothetical protein